MSFLLRPIWSFWSARGEILEAWIVPKRIEHRIEPDQRKSKQHAHAKRGLEQFLQSAYGAVRLSHLRGYPGKSFSVKLEAHHADNIALRFGDQRLKRFALEGKPEAVIN
jgi:hypothetical protein